MIPDTCPNCGAEVPRGARACPDCGADERTGWSEEAGADRLGLSASEEFDHDEFVRREFGGRGRRGKRSVGVGLWWWVALAILLALLLGVFW